MAKRPKKKVSEGTALPDEFLLGNLKNLKQSFSNVTLEEEVLKAYDVLASVVGNVPDYKALTANAKNGDDKSFLALVKIHSNLEFRKFDYKGLAKFALEKKGTDVSSIPDDPEANILNPRIYLSDEFIKQDWVQQFLTDRLSDNDFQVEFWDAFICRVTGRMNFRSDDKQIQFKTYVALRKDAWNEELAAKDITFQDIDDELRKYGIIGKDLTEDSLEEDDYNDLESLRKMLNRCGVIANNKKGT